MADPTPLPWMVTDPYWGTEHFATEAEAVAAAEHTIDGYCADGGWDETVEEITVSRVTHVVHEVVLGVRAEMDDDAWAELTHGDGDDHDRWIRYELRPGCPERRETTDD